jgi:tol-pal system protein YbgF
MSVSMIRWLGLPLILFVSWAVAAEPDTDRQVPVLQPNRPVLISSAEAETARQVEALQLQVRTLEARLTRLESLLQNNSALDLLKEVEAMKAEISRLRGQSEIQTHQMESLGKRQNDLYTDLDKRLEDLNKQVKAAAAAPEPVSPPATALVASTQLSFAPPSPSNGDSAAAPVQPPATASHPDEEPLAESKAYGAALNQFRSGNYVAAVAGFKNFLKAFPGSSLASNAQYWTGYSYYALKDYKTALSQQLKLINAYPESAKVPDALLNIASCQTELDDNDKARKTLDEIVSKHPGTNAARIAARRLAATK